MVDLLQFWLFQKTWLRLDFFLPQRFFYFYLDISNTSCSLIFTEPTTLCTWQQCTLFLSHSTTSRYSANCEIFFKNYAAFQKRRKRKSASIKKYFCPQNQFTDIIDTFFASSLVGTLQNQGRDTNLLYLYDPINRKVIKSWRLSVIVKNFAYPIEKDNCSDNIFFRCQSISRNDARNRWKEHSSWAFLTVLETE